MNLAFHKVTCSVILRIRYTPKYMFYHVLHFELVLLAEIIQSMNQINGDMTTIKNLFLMYQQNVMIKSPQLVVLAVSNQTYAIVESM